MRLYANRWMIPLWMLVVTLGMTLPGCAVRQLHPTAELSPMAKPTTNTPGLLYSVDQIEADTVILLPRCPNSDPIAVAHNQLAFVQEGDILYTVDDLDHAYSVDEETTRRIKVEVHDLLIQLQKGPEPSR